MVQTLDPHTILNQLGITGTTSLERVHGGFDAAIWRVESERGMFALRIMHPSQVEVSRHEIAAMKAAKVAGIHTPEVVAFEVLNDRPVMLLEWLPGTTLIKALQTYPLKIWSLGLQFGHMQAVIHTATAPPELHEEESSWIEWTGDDERVLQAKLRTLPLKHNALLHLDYHPLNVMSDGRSITGVIDWTNARAGDPRADFARTYTILRVEPWSATPSIGIEIFRRAFAAAWRRGYEQVTGKLHDLPLFFAWAGIAMVHDLSPRVENQNSWFEAKHIDHIRRWTRRWKQEANVMDS